MTSDNQKHSFLNETTKFQEDSITRSKIFPEKSAPNERYKPSPDEKAVLSGLKENFETFENNENSSLVSNSGNKDRIHYKSNREAVQPRRIFG